MSKKYILLICCLLISCFSFSQDSSKAFTVVPLGILGGLDESNLSAYMVAAKGTNDYVCLDAGTLHYGIEKAISNKVFSISAGEVIRKYIKGYCISHSHLDQISGLIINSPDDSTKTIYASPDCIETLKTHYFTWESWANFTDEGEAPLLKKYHYKILLPDSVTSITNTQMTIQAFPLHHSNLLSSAFLVNSNDRYLLYLGDTGEDENEKSDDLHKLWQAVAPLIQQRKLKAIFIEASFPDEQPANLLFGHLTPQLLMKEMNDLALLTGTSTLKEFPIVITHTKPPQSKIESIKKQLVAENKLQFHLIFPEQGEAFDL